HQRSYLLAWLLSRSRLSFLDKSLSARSRFRTRVSPKARLPEGLDKPSPTACSTAFSVKPFFTAFLTAFSTFFAAFFFALSFAIFPHNYFCRRAAVFTVFFTAFLTAFLAGIFLAATFLVTFFAIDSLPAVLGTGFLTAFGAGAFFAAFFACAFFATCLTGVFFAGAFFKTPVTVVTAAPTAVFTTPATSSAIAIPKPTASPA